MKSIFTRSLLLLCFFVCASMTSAHATAIDDLNQVIAYSNQGKNNAKNARTAARSLAIMYFQYNNQNIGGYIVQIQDEMSELEEASDEIIYYINSAAAKNPNINPDEIEDWASDLEALEDQVNNEALNLEQLIASNQRSEARVSYRLVRSYLNQQIALCNLIRLEAIALKNVPQSYNVQIQLIYNGQPYNGSTTLGGFYGYNQDLGQYFYPNQGYDDNLFYDLPAGTYTFGSYDGYFDGTGTTTVTLDPSMIGSNGFVVVELSYWSE